VFISFVTALWFGWGGLRDIRLLFKKLAVQKINHLDDGTVIGRQNLDERGAFEASPMAADNGNVPMDVR
jgi:SSS family solute:Na+ symporter